METRATEPITQQAIEEHLDAVLRSPGFEDSVKYSELLRYLVNASLADRTPHEIDIAVDVFGKGQDYDPGESSSIRVYVHHLRKKLDEYYAASAGESPIRMRIPKGSYRLSFGVALIAPRNVSDAGSRRSALAFGGFAAVCVLLLISLAGNALLLLPPDSPSPEAEAPPSPTLPFAWRDLAEGPEPVLIVLGDIFFFEDAGRYPDRTHFIRDIEINSPEELRQLTVDPGGSSGPYGPSVQPSSLTYLPKATAFALQEILPITSRLGKPVSLRLMSEVTGEDLRRNHVVYIGFIRSMGALQDYFFQTSSFSAEPRLAEIRHESTGEVFATSGSIYGQIQDFGLFSKIPGPGDATILVFTGIHDVGILYAARAFTDPERSAALERDLAQKFERSAAGIEVLFKVSGYGRSDLEATIAMTVP